ncbi:Intracellular serine protease [Lasiodiplodia theobromae]|uniref:Intracellular serine protease n=1 Tax=Lasiodiplodia theobromae TaxID=45133 RepID=UPI0015C2F6BE|nr:Intracellular serine protease [Lasiodiplodia theobromae]KAF4537794.1 Intracellular serine protease [Lasiodiplodia theobromae]
MDDPQLWMTSEEDDDQYDVEGGTSFILELRPEGESGGFHVRNRPGESQRLHTTEYYGGRRKKPAFNVGAVAKAIIHGTLDQLNKTPATLLVYDFSFFSHRRSTRIKDASITFEFQARGGKSIPGPTVEKVAPYGKYVMMQTTETVTRTIGADGGISGGVIASLSTNLRGDQSIEKTTTHAAEIVGNNPCDDWSNRFLAQWTLKENESQKNGIVSRFRACILLSNTGEEFDLLPTVKVTPDLKTKMVTLVAFRRGDDPVKMVPTSPPIDNLEEGLGCDRGNLGAVDLGRVWDCDMADIMGSAELDELDHSSAESLNEYEVESEEDHESGDEAEKTWKAQQLHEQCRDVMDALTRNMRRWDENTGTEGVPVLEEYKKITLATGKAGTYPRIETALHTLARDKLLFGNLQPDIRSKLVQYLWDHRSTYSDSGHDSSVTGDPVLAVALRSDNGVFIDCVEKCLGDSFPMLLSLQDGEGKNCIHHLFFWDQANNRDRRSKDRILGQMERLAPRADAGTLATADTNGNTPIHYALDYNQCLNKPDKYVEIVKAMVQSADAVMRESGTVLNKFGDSPILVTSKSKAFKDIRDFLTVHYIRTRSDADARTLIYGRNASGLVRNLYFDAIGQQDAQDITDLLQRMSDGGFGTTLAYVNLPTVRFNPPRRSSAELSGLPRRKVKPKTNQKSLPENPGVGRTELVQVFKKLYDLNVRSILRLSVEDRQSPSHTDAAIEEALQGRESITDGAGSSRPIAVEKW